jgi:prephenate dehydrogenase
MNTYEDNHSLPFLKGQFRMFSAVLKEQPHLNAEITSFAENLMLEAINANKKLNSDRKLLVAKNN